jgi:PBP1b-binding outer membrane lipoprotein LpoB
VKIIKLLFIIFLIIGCKYNPEKSNYSPPDVNWTSSDEMPSFEVCNDLVNESERKSCFNTKIINLIYSNLSFEKIRVNNKINDTLIISLLINEKGKISLIGIKNEDKLVNKIPELKTLIGNSLEKIPSLYPATKTNMGIPVSSKFSLPLIIKSN